MGVGPEEPLDPKLPLRRFGETTARASRDLRQDDIPPSEEIAGEPGLLLTPGPGGLQDLESRGEQGRIDIGADARERGLHPALSLLDSPVWSR